MATSKGYRLTASTGIHKGDREYQQDQVRLISHARVPGCVMAVVADGMGGRSGGRKASDQVMMTCKQLFDRYSPDHDDTPTVLRQMVQESHLVIKLTAISSEQEPHSTIAATIRRSPVNEADPSSDKAKPATVALPRPANSQNSGRGVAYSSTGPTFQTRPSLRPSAWHEWQA